MDVGPSAGVLLLARLLVLPALDLSVAVAKAVEDNPALEFTERPRCLTCGRVLRGTRCRWCGPPSLSGFERAIAEDPRATLKRDLRLVLPRSEHDLAERLVDELDPRGLLGRPAGALATEMGVPTVRVEAVLGAMEKVAPAGVGAVDIRASLLAQFDAWEGAEPPTSTRALIERIDVLAERGVEGVARELGVSVEDVSAAMDFVATHLSPAPLDLGSRDPMEGAPVDLVVHEEADGSLSVEAPDASAYGVRVADRMAEVARDPSQSGDTRAWAASRVQLARLFLAQLEQSTNTVLRIGKIAVEYQAAFVRRGPAEHRPLTRVQLSTQVGLHESTVSRAVAGKRARLPNGAVVNLEAFFGTNVAVKAVLRELLTELPGRSDAVLASELTRRGHSVARRTVAKYRAELGAPKSPSPRIVD